MLFQVFAQFRQLAFEQNKRTFESSKFVPELHLQFLDFQWFVFNGDAVEVQVGQLLVPDFDECECFG